MPRNLKRLRLACFAFAFALLLLVSVSTHATNLTVTCTAPTTNADGTPLATGATIGFNVYGGMQGSPLVLLTPTPLATCSRTATNVNAGTVCYTVSAVETINGAASESAQTAPICTVVNSATPSPPINVNVTVSVPGVANTAYILKQGTPHLVLSPAGTVPAGTVCNPFQAVLKDGLTYDLVSPAVVTWTGTAKAQLVFAQCS